MQIRRISAAAAALALAGCLLQPGQEPRQGVMSGTKMAPPKGPAKPELGVEDLKDNPLPPVSAEPAWRELIRHTRFMAPAQVWHPGPSPDGKRVAYATTEFGPRPQIAVRDVQGATPVQISSAVADHLFPRISPCGTKVAFASNREGNWDLYVARIDAPATVVQLTLESTDDIAPSWSPDGKKIVYSSRTGEGIWQLVIVDVASRVKTYLGAGLYPDWSADPKDPWIAFQSQPRQAGGRSGVWVVRPDGTEVREVVADKGQGWSALQPRFSPCGRWIAFASLQRSPEARLFGAPADADDLWLIRPDGTFEMRLTDDPSGESWPAWGGDRVYFVSSRGGTANLYSLRVKPLEDHP
jgi:Tol biopolymer transport system component